ncbi:MAG: FHA domain-containing protein [Myxococcales bacterium]|nr:FHA domain-containing protein [Myxococcales bacterium]
MALTLLVSDRASPDAAAPKAVDLRASGRLSFTGQPGAITLDQPRIVIGRGAHVDVRLPSRAVSDKHAVLTLDGAEAALVDEGSTNGTRVNGVLIPRGRRKALKSGDVIGIGPYALVVQVVTAMPDPPERTASLARKLLVDTLRAVGSDTAPPQLVLASTRRAGKSWTLEPDKRRVVIGRGEGCEVLLEDRDCSRQHAEIFRDGEGYLLRDLGSKNGLEFGGRAVNERRLRHNDQFVVGKTTLRFHDPTEELLRAFEVGDDERSPTPASPSLPPSPEPERSTPEAETHARRRESLGPTVSDARETVQPAPSAIAPKAGRADWLVVALCGVILVISAVALAIVLKAPR